MVLCIKLTITCCFTSFRLSHENQAGRHNSRWFLTEIISHSMQADGVSLCLLGAWARQPSELSAKLLRVSSATQSPALQSQQSSSPRVVVLAPAQGLVQLGLCWRFRGVQAECTLPYFALCSSGANSSEMAELCNFAAMAFFIATSW